TRKAPGGTWIVGSPLPAATSHRRTGGTLAGTLSKGGTGVASPTAASVLPSGLSATGPPAASRASRLPVATSHTLTTCSLRWFASLATADPHLYATATVAPSAEKAIGPISPHGPVLSFAVHRRAPLPP